MIKTYNANLVRSLVKELLILNRTEGRYGGRSS